MNSSQEFRLDPPGRRNPPEQLKLSVDSVPKVNRSLFECAMLTGARLGELLGLFAIAGQTFKDIDVLLLPTTTGTTPAIKVAVADPQALSPENTVFANYYGLPAISVPCGFDKNGLPLGLQIVGKPWDEATVLHVAYRYETTTPWKTKHPDV